jgi:prephenate dehydrogenase
MEPEFRKIAIIGMGLIGGSLGLIIHKNNIAERVIGIGRNPEKLNKALCRHAVDEVTTDYTEGVKESNLVVLCTPVRCIVPIFKEIYPFLPDKCIVTDAGSTKSSIMQNIQSFLTQSISGKKITFIGSHPMAGSEQSGIDAARDDLYDNSLCIITVPENLSAQHEDVFRVEHFWKKAGCKVLKMKSDLHDSAVAAVSHLPHLMASVLVHTVAKIDNNSGNLPLIASTGFKDTTRVASGNPDIWTDISLENKKALLESVDEFERQLSLFKKALQSEDSVEIHRFFEKARNYRDSVIISKNKTERKD